MQSPNDKKNKLTIGILTPVFNEEENLARYVETVSKVLLPRNGMDFRFLFIDDGSADNSWKIIREICMRDSRFTGIRLSRNYGSHIALSAGFDNMKDTDAVATLACDLQDPPEVILQLLDEWQKGAHIVWGKRRTREDKKWRIFVSNAFHSLLRRFAMPRGSKFTTGSFFLVDRRVARGFRRFGEQNRITFAIVAWTGFDQAVVEYDRKPRVAGKSGWTFSKMVKTMYDAFFGFSFMPIRVMSLIGALVFLFAIILSGYIIYSWISGVPRPGWSSTMLGMSFFFGIQFLLLSLIGEYLYRIYNEVLDRPLYFVSMTTGKSEDDKPE